MLQYWCCNRQNQVYQYLGVTSTTNVNSFYRATACNATHGIAVAILSVRLSVRPSVRQMRVL